MSKSYSFILNDQEFVFNLDFELLSSFPKEIRNELFAKDKYVVQSNVPKEIFQTFFDYFLDNSKIPTLNSDNIYFYFLLNDEFGFLTDLLSDPELEKMYKISIIKNTNKENNPNYSKVENFISQNLEFYLKNYPNEMYSIPITSLCNIFYSKNCNIRHHDIAYQFITNTLPTDKKRDTIDENFYVLIGSLDSIHLSPKILKDSISKRDDHFGFIPKIDFSQIENTKNELEEANEALKKQVEDLSESNEKLSNQIDSIKLTKEALKKQVSNLSKSNEKLSNQIDSIRLTNEALKKQVKDLSKSNKELSDQIDSIKLANEALKKQVDELQSSNQKLEEKCDENWSLYQDSQLKREMLKQKNKNLKLELKNKPPIDFDIDPLEVERLALEKCEKIKKQVVDCKTNVAVFPMFLKAIPDNFFINCSKLQKVEIPPSLTVIGNKAFKNCTLLVQVSIPPSVTQIGSKAFSNCKALKSISIPPFLQVIENETFSGCISLSMVKFGKFIKEIKSRAFKCCKSLTEVKIDAFDITVADNAFEDCTAIFKINAINSVTKY